MRRSERRTYGKLVAGGSGSGRGSRTGGTAAATDTNDGDGAVYENQRWRLRGGYGGKQFLLPTDRRAWSNAAGTRSADTFQAVTGEDIDAWRAIVSDGTDDQGWQYAFNFTRNAAWKPKMFRSAYCRRRRWVRCPPPSSTSTRNPTSTSSTTLFGVPERAGFSGGAAPAASIHTSNAFGIGGDSDSGSGSGSDSGSDGDGGRSDSASEGSGDDDGDEGEGGALWAVAPVQGQGQGRATAMAMPTAMREEAHRP